MPTKERYVSYSGDHYELLYFGYNDLSQFDEILSKQGAVRVPDYESFYPRFSEIRLYQLEDGAIAEYAQGCALLYPSYKIFATHTCSAWEYHDLSKWPKRFILDTVVTGESDKVFHQVKDYVGTLLVTASIDLKKSESNTQHDIYNVPKLGHLLLVNNQYWVTKKSDDFSELVKFLQAR